MAKININLDSLKPKREWKRHKVKEGHNVYRLLPPFGDASNGYPYHKWMISWGLVDVETGRQRPFASTLNTEAKQCPIFQYVEALTKKAEGIKASMKTEGATDNQIKERLKDLNKVIGNVRPKTVYAYNAINKAGEVGILEIKTTAQKELKALMMEYIKDYNQDPTSLNSADDDSGVWFDFVRTGMGFDTEYKVNKVQTRVKTPAGKTTFEDDRSALPDNVVQNYESMAYDLNAIYQSKSYDELKQILLANIREIVKDVPEASVVGFDDFSSVPTVKVDTDGGDDEPEEKTVATVSTTGKTKVSLKLDSIDDEDEIEVTRSSSNGKAKTTPAEDEDDIFKLANSFLES